MRVIDAFSVSTYFSGSKNLDLDVLGYWKDNNHRLSDLADMAHELLIISITTVVSK